MIYLLQNQVDVLPNKPATQAKLESITVEEQKINIQEQITKAIKKAELIKL